ncbi:MAG TPA: DUF2191 domain-containing protein [Terriglobia bacterium]|nr:DUF2191 domain-containing protein [Terriglobia bacterium]
MRTTLTLDDDIAAKLRTEVRRSGQPFKEVVNQTLRIGLNYHVQAKSLPPYKVKARDLGLRPGFDLDNIEELLDRLEGPFRR